MKPSDHIIVYSPKEGKSFFRILLEVLTGFREGYGLGLQLAKRDLKAMYRQSFLGFAWAVFTPIAQTLVWVFLSSRGVINVTDTGIPYPLFVLSGIMLWQVFMESLNAPLMMFNSSRGILTKLNINKESLIITGILKVLFNLAIKLIVLIPLMIYFQVNVSSMMVMAIPAIIMVIIFGFSLGIWLTPIGALYSDVQRFIQAFAQLFFFLTPIIYPRRVDGFFGVIDTYNPAAIFICNARDLLLGVFETSYIYYGLSSLLVVIFFLVGLVIYRISVPIIVERMGS